MPLLNSSVLRTDDAQTRVNIVPTCDKPLEAVRSGQRSPFALRTGNALRTACAKRRCVGQSLRHATSFHEVRRALARQ